MSGFFSHSSSRRRYPNPNMGGTHYRKKGLFGMLSGLGSGFSSRSYDGYNGHGYPNQGYPNQGYANQGYPNQGYANQGYPNQSSSQAGTGSPSAFQPTSPAAAG